MPYVVEKAAYISIIDSLLSDTDRRIAALRRLRAGDNLASLCGFDSTNLGAPASATGVDPGFGDQMTPADRIAHMNGDWFGMAKNLQGAWLKQPDAFPTGFWIDYQGDPERILRDAMTRAIEVSFDVRPDEVVDDPCCLRRQWPIDLYWICQGPVFQCWVLWRQEDAGASGHVTLLITTPAAAGHPLTSKITRPVSGAVPYTKPEYASPPPPDARRNRKGMWVVGHEDYDRSWTCSTDPSGLGSISWPTVEWRAVDQTKVVCVVPAEWEGGVLHDGRPYCEP